ncbi:MULTISPECIES: METTL5 family protein [unclassified Methanoregula]|uniref:METTL5 family protein n=1 Tax=unclassified Methanoregula TaxID=2649730 RepID=UPI0009C8014C|nr:MULTISPECIES: METTL5 family protein [unclassified Methanoregula]OPX62283.1 MAG: ribosomal protein L11 methyltransferase [Methanoregula sp. PtaB.Bin085]OPY32710.1 MAG: ribosomal protein L11 methyltransferase [Methanoregula sp. PtaU1.Bin006]
MKLKQLEMTLQRLRGFSRPRASLEQYQTPAPLAARLLYHALMKGDIKGKQVADLGCGTGVLAIGAALLGAESVTGMDIDEKALAVARENADLLDAEVAFITADVREGGCRERIGTCDTVVMNPPFGAQKAHADRPFIDCALAVAEVTYSIFNAGSIPFVEAYTARKAEIDEKIGGSFPIQRTFAFHTKDVQEIEVEILRLKRIA